MKKALIIAIILSLVLFASAPLFGQAAGLAENLAGRILLQVQKNGEAWYVNPGNLKRYYMADGDDAFRIMRALGVGISNANLAKIPTYNNDQWSADKNVIKYVRGKIVLQTEANGEAWYVSPVNNRRYYLGRPAEAYQLMRNLGLGISDAKLAEISIGTVDDDGDGDDDDNGGGDDDGGGTDAPSFRLPISNIDDVTGIQVFHDPDSSQLHTGFDFELPNPTTIYSPFEGEITDIIKTQMSNGYWLVDVLIKINSKYTTFIAFEPWTKDESVINAQLAKISVTKGDTVKEGQVLGTLDSVPNSEFPHIHWQVEEDDEPVRPYNYCSASAKAQLDILYARFGKTPQ
ncbi:M23 family metallopeptidase [Patescibacteria group bacterium]